MSRMGGESMIAEIFQSAVAYDSGDARRIQHFVKVHDFARQIGLAEGLAEGELETLEIAAILHDIGIHASEETYGDCGGKHQEEMGPPIAGELLQGFPLSEEQRQRICFLIAHHHTYNNVQGLDYQILLEADFLVNAYEDNLPQEAICCFAEKVFKTQTGKTMLYQMFGIK